MNVVSFTKPQVVYVSLVRDFLNTYLRVEIGAGAQFADEMELRRHMNDQYRRWWCSIYTQEQFDHFPKEVWYIGEPTVYASFAELDEQIVLRGLLEVTDEENRKFKKYTLHKEF